LAVLYLTAGLLLACLMASWALRWWGYERGPVAAFVVAAACWASSAPWLWFYDRRRQPLLNSSLILAGGGVRVAVLGALMILAGRFGWFQDVPFFRIVAGFYLLTLFLESGLLIRLVQMRPDRFVA
jgi:hypothetical protein